MIAREKETAKVQEMEGWVSLWHRKGMYDDPALENSFALPDVAGPEVTRLFHTALCEMDLKGDEVILDIGAGQGWASRYFAERGCKVIAIDLVADEWFGLGRSWAIMEHAGVYFEPVLADGEHLPFPEDKFDRAFFFGALHHFEQFEDILRCVYAVLKPGSSLIAAGEPSIPIFAREQDVQATLEEVEEGITERRPKTFQYWWALRKDGFRTIRVDVLDTYNATPSRIHDWIVGVRRNLCQVARPRYKPLVWLGLSVLRLFPYRWAAWLTLCINGGNLFLRAVKPACQAEG